MPKYRIAKGLRMDSSGKMVFQFTIERSIIDDESCDLKWTHLRLARLDAPRDEEFVEIKPLFFNSLEDAKKCLEIIEKEGIEDKIVYPKE